MKNFIFGFGCTLVLSIAAPPPAISQTDEITSSSNYLQDDNDYNYGAEFYLYNNTDHTLRAYYRLEGEYNVSIQSDGGITDVPAYTKVWFITVTTADLTQSWNSGTLNFNWEKPE